LQRLPIDIARDVKRIAIVLTKVRQSGKQRVAGSLQAAAISLKSSAVSQGLQQHMAMDEFELLSVKSEHIDLVGISRQLDIIPFGVLNDLIVPEKTGFRHGDGREKGFSQRVSPD
jgi:hypothetical protein